METADQASKRLYSSRIIDTYLKLLSKRYPLVDIPELLAAAGMKPYEVADQWHWFTQEQIDRFYAELVTLTGNEDIAREAGRYAASPEALGVMRKYALSFFNPANLFERLEQSTAYFTKSSIYKAKKLAPTKVEITVVPVRGSNEKPFQCLNRLGFFEALVTMFNARPPRIEHPECMFKGYGVCRYLISWEKTSASVLRRATSIATLSAFFCIFALLAAGHLWQISPLAITSTLFLLGLLVLLMVVITERLEKQVLFTSLESTKDATNQLISQVSNDYDKALMINEIGQVISRQTNLTDILHNLSRILEERLDFDRGLLLLADPARTQLQFQTGFGYTREQLVSIMRTSSSLRDNSEWDIFGRTFHEQKPFLINDPSELSDLYGVRGRALAEQLGTRSFICCPIIADNKSLGVLAVDKLKSHRPLIQSDISLLTGITPMIGISIRNADLLEARERQFNSVIQVLASSTDARDPMTAGHSERVTQYALGICQELGLGVKYGKMIQVAALLHDYGKIGVPDTILKKPGELTEEEYEIVKTHAAKTEEILAKANFQGIFRQIPEIAGAHHEKLDGSGYPRGLCGEEIPLGARIIAVADVFEALTTERHYRTPLPMEEVFVRLQKKSGLHFDKRVVEALIRHCRKHQPLAE